MLKTRPKTGRAPTKSLPKRRTSVYSVPAERLLTRIRSRHTQPLKVSADKIQWVARSYLNHISAHARVVKTVGNASSAPQRQRALQVKTLDNVLRAQIKAMKARTETIKRRLAQVEQDKTQRLTQLEAAKQCVCSGLQVVRALNDQKLLVTEHTRSNSDCSLLVRRLASVSEQQAQLKHALQAESSKNARLATANVISAHDNDLLTMQNIIMGDFLRLINETGMSFSEAAVTSQFSELQTSIRSYSGLIPLEVLRPNLFSVNSHMLLDSEQFKALQKAYSDIQQTGKLHKIKVNEARRELVQAQEVNEGHRVICTNLERRIAAMTQQFETAKEALVKVYIYRGLGAYAEEEYCQVCYNLYTEYHNSNSCKQHLSPWNGSVYFCCGNTNKTATGCVALGHVSQEYAYIRDELKERRAQLCSNCREKGHHCSECPKDPNVMGIEDQEAQLFRIKFISQRKNAKRLSL